jgi:hypothetical protein
MFYQPHDFVIGQATFVESSSKRNKEGEDLLCCTITELDES